jgi:hypothetical protein
VITRVCRNYGCSRQTPPQVEGARAYVYCTDCRTARILAIARRNMRNRRAQANPVSRSWWLGAPRDGFTAKAEGEAERMSPSKGAEIARQMEAIRWW